jgi:hypothetical protein
MCVTFASISHVYPSVLFVAPVGCFFIGVGCAGIVLAAMRAVAMFRTAIQPVLVMIVSVLIEVHAHAHAHAIACTNVIMHAMQFAASLCFPFIFASICISSWRNYTSE